MELERDVAISGVRGDRWKIDGVEDTYVFIQNAEPSTPQGREAGIVNGYNFPSIKVSAESPEITRVSANHRALSKVFISAEYSYEHFAQGSIFKELLAELPIPHFVGCQIICQKRYDGGVDPQVIPSIFQVLAGKFLEVDMRNQKIFNYNPDPRDGYQIAFACGGQLLTVLARGVSTYIGQSPDRLFNIIFNIAGEDVRTVNAILQAPDIEEEVVYQLYTHMTQIRHDIFSAPSEGPKENPPWIVNGLTKRS
jgi:hypothetical protein